MEIQGSDRRMMDINIVLLYFFLKINKKILKQNKCRHLSSMVNRKYLSFSAILLVFSGK